MCDVSVARMQETRHLGHHASYTWGYAVVDLANATCMCIIVYTRSANEDEIENVNII